ncbi:hypothetical protein ACFY8O_16310 [Streptomyces argenteolus]|uniref:Uncharacterized protein n=1 Tax=Streptomyces argenteolus TaxID=67274 RepID=A0ABW6X7M2_9ACTN
MQELEEHRAGGGVTHLHPVRAEHIGVRIARKRIQSGKRSGRARWGIEHAMSRVTG